MAGLSKEQEKGLDLSRDLVLTAGAGSGKTRVLVERFIHILEEEPGTCLDDIVAFTFTDKAAAEMREKVRKRIGEHALAGGERWREMLLHFDRARISTVHSFCSEILRENALDAGLDPDFTVLDDVEATRLRASSVERTIKQVAEGGGTEAQELEKVVKALSLRVLRGLLEKMQSDPHKAEQACRVVEDNEPAKLLELWRSRAEPKVQPAEDEESIAITRIVARLWRRTFRVYNELKGKGRRLDFQDLELLALGLLTKTGRDVAGKARHVLLDELQDTNPVQWEIVQAFSSGGARLFCVGDVKQSIYAFRGAHAHIVQDAKERLKVKEEVLAESYRSLPAIVDFVNLFFRALMEDRRDGGSWNVPFEKLECMRRGGPAGTVTVHVANPAGMDGEPGVEEAPGIAQWVKAAVESAPPLQVFDKETDEWHAARYSDIAILARTKTNLPEIADALRAAGVPFWISKGVGFYERQEVRDVWNLFKTLVDPRDDVALALVLRSPIFGLSDEALMRLANGIERTLWGKICSASRRIQSEPEGARALPNHSGDPPPPEPALDGDEGLFDPGDARAITAAVNILEYHRMRLDRASLSRILGDILDEAGAWGAYASSIRGHQVTGNVRKLLSVIRDFERDVSPLTQDVLEHLSINIEQGIREGEAAPEEAQNAVQLMTVHAAKGLEFPIVCLADAGHGFNLSENAQFEMDPQLGIGVRLRLPDGKRENSTGLGAIKEEIRQSTLAEEKRLFYVAATRARDHLFISGKAPAGSRLSFFHWLLGLPKPVGGLELVKNEKLIRVKVGSNEVSLPIYTPPMTVAPTEEVARETGHWNQLYEFERRLAAQSPRFVPQRVRPLHGQVPGLRLTAGDLVTFEECPRKYDLQHRHGIPEWTLFHKGSDPEAEALRTRALQAQKMGMMVHRIFERLSCVDPDHIDSLINTVCIEAQVPVDKYAPELRELVKRALNSPLKPLLLKEEGTDMEDRFTITEGPHVVEGVIDRVSLDGSTATIMDYKTVRVVEDGRIREDRLKKAVNRSTLQLGLYSKAVKKAHGVSQVKSYLLFTDCPDRPQEVDPGADVGVEKTISDITDSCRSGVFDPPDRPGQSKLCRECGFWQLRICRPE